MFEPAVEVIFKAAELFGFFDEDFVEFCHDRCFMIVGLFCFVASGFYLPMVERFQYFFKVIENHSAIFCYGAV